jgi:CHASE3 domain sensor protein
LVINDLRVILWPMQSRVVRLTLLSLVLLAGAVGVFFTWDIYRRTTAALERERDVDARLHRMNEAVASLAAAQHAYVAPGQPRGEWFSRATASVQELYDQVAALQPRVHAPESPAALRSFAETVDTAVKADDRARDTLRADQELMAADIIYADARQILDSMTTQLRALRQGEAAAADAEHRALLTRAATVIAACGSIWIIGLVMLAKAPAPRIVHESPVMEASTPPVPAEAMDHVEAIDNSAPAPIDLGGVADVCTGLARMTDAAALPDVLERVASVLDARGIVVWLGAGEELFVGAAHGYPHDMASRVGPISRSADNPTAEAWREGQLRLVPSTPMTYGAVVAPLLRPDGCFGVFAAELRNQREREAATQAVAVMIAAQLSSILAAGPPPSSAENPAVLDSSDSTRATA